MSAITLIPPFLKYKFINLHKYSIYPQKFFFQLSERLPFKRRKFIIIRLMNKNKDYNISNADEQAPQVSSDQKQRQKCNIIGLVKRFVKEIDINLSNSIKYLPKGKGFSLLLNEQTLRRIQLISTETLGQPLRSFQSQIVRLGFNIRIKQNHKRKTLKKIYTYNQSFLDFSPQIKKEFESDQSSSSSEMMDDFPNEEQQQQINKQKQAQGRGFVKPNFTLIKARSDGFIGINDKKRNIGDISLQVKLQNQQILLTPYEKKSSSPDLDYQQPNYISIAQRNTMFKQNHQKCSKMIDSAMFQILSAHRGKKIKEKADVLLQKVIEIYDILSDNIENANAVVKEIEKKGRKQSQYSSPGFKPLNGMGDNLK